MSSVSQLNRLLWDMERPGRQCGEGGGVPSAIADTVVLGGKGKRMAGDILLCCATITATITATASAPHVAPAAGAAW